MKALVAHLSSVHPAVDTRISVKECGALAAAGYDVVFVCQHEGDAVVNGVHIISVPKRHSRFARMLFGVWDVLRAGRKQGADVYHLHDAELLFAGLVLRFTGAAVIYDVHEDLPRQILAKSWMPRVLRRPVAFIAQSAEGLLARGMSRIVAATPLIARRFPADRTTTVQNFAMLDELRLDRPTPYVDRGPMFAYIGGIATIRGIFEMVAAVGLVAPQLGARLTLAGLVGEDALLDKLKRTRGWNLVEYHGWRTREQVAAHLDAVRAGLLLIHPTENYVDSYPGKAFEYMAAGLPLIVSDFPLWRELFEEIECAIFVNPLDPQAIARAMTWVLENPDEAERMGARGRLAARTRFNWQAESAKLLHMYDALLPQSNPRMIRAQAL
jgi:hypothetical protein